MEAKVSIIIPVYNCEQFVAQAIESVLSQECTVECIVVDDGSTDGTADVVRAYGDDVIYLYQQNSERSAARNNGIARATGKYIGFLDADDLLLPGKLKEQVEFLERHPDYDVVYSKVYYFKENQPDGRYVVNRPTPSGDILPLLIYTNFITMNSPLFTKNAVQRAGVFDVTFCRYEDWDFLLRLALTGSRFGYLESTNAACRMHGANTVKDLLRMFESKLAVARKVVTLFDTELSRRGIDGGEVIAFHQADYGRNLILAGQVAEGRTLIRDACRLPFPHRRKFRLFSLLASICGYRFVDFLQNSSNRLLKYRRADS